jgi:hypothetical protein
VSTNLPESDKNDKNRSFQPQQLRNSMYKDEWYIEKKKKKNYAAALLSLCMGLPKSCASLTDHAYMLARQTKGPVLLLDAAAFPLEDIATDLKQTRERRKRKGNPHIIVPRHSSCTTAHNPSQPPLNSSLDYIHMIN